WVTPSALSDEARNLRAQRVALAAQPLNLALALEVAEGYARLGQSESDPRYYAYARSALSPWWENPDPPLSVLLLRAQILQAGHEFAAALADLDRVLAADPRNPQARLTRALLLQTRGDFENAGRACVGLFGVVSPLSLTTCAAGAGAMTGKAEKSASLLERAVRDPGAASVDERLWALTVLGEISAQAGRPAEAERAFQKALSLGWRSVYLLAAFSDFLLDQGRFAEAAEFLKDETRSDALLLRLAIAEQATGLPKAAEHRQILESRFGTLRLRGEKIHGREEARFALHVLADSKRALALARENWETQREPADVRIFLEAAAASKKIGAATPVLNWIRRSGFKDARIASVLKQFGGKHP
ncbi:MAG: hypothetical protein AB1405_16215, partial [Bdellovibrionota bacterium]